MTWRTVFKAGTEGGSINVEHDSTAQPPFRATMGEYYELPDEDPISSHWTREASTFDDALREFDRYPWHRFVPITIDPAFKQNVQRAWSQRSDPGSRQHQRWQKALES